MAEISLKPNIYLESFPNLSNVYDKILSLGGEKRMIYKGRVDQISEKLAMECVEHNVARCKFKNYQPDVFKPEGIKMMGFNYAVISIESASFPNEYCVIFDK